MEAALNLITLFVGLVITIVWIVSLAKWDGRKPCEPDNCNTCPYKGTDCKPDPKPVQKSNHNS